MRLGASLLAVALLSGCIKVGPDYRPPTQAMPDHWATQLDGAKPNQALQDWWLQFNDAELNRLMAEAVVANLDLQQALVKIKDLRAQRTAIWAGALPSLSGRGTVSRRFNSSASATQGGAAQGGGFGIGNNLINIFQSGFDAPWEVDFFGGVQRSLEAADATLASEQANSQAVQVTLLAEVARYYLQLRENQQLQAVAETNLDSQRQTVELTRVRQQAGLATALEVNQAQAQLAATEAQLPLYQTQTEQAMHALSVLLGRQPGQLADRLAKPAAIPLPSAAPWPELPSALLQRRPDIRRAERQLATAVANIGVATAQLYPKLNLTAFLGLQNSKITDVTPLGKSWSTAASLTFPIFNWGELNATIDSKKAQAEQLALAYRAVVLSALKEVEDALTAYHQELKRKQPLAQAVAANQDAVAVASERYQKGLTGFLDVLVSQQALYQAQTQLVSSQTTLSADLAALYKALGGGWRAAPL